MDIRGEWIEVEGLRIHCLMAGQTGAPVLLLHGGGFDSAFRSYKQSIGPISQYHRVFAPDWPGYGESDKPKMRYTTEYFDLQGKMTRVEDLYFEEAISRERFDSKKAEIDTQVATIRAEMDELEDIDETIQVAEEARRFLLDNRYILFGGGPVMNWITTHALFAPHKYLPQEVQEHWDWITPEKRQEFYRRMNLKVKVYQDDDPILEISGVPVCQNARSRNIPSR